MKKFFISLFFSCILLNMPVSFAEETGRVIEAFVSAEDEANEEIPWNQGKESLPDAVVRTGKDILNMYKYFDEQFPGEALMEDFSDEVAARYPQLSQKEVREREQNIRLILGWYRNGKKFYEDIKSKLLVPNDPPLIVEDKDYDDGSVPAYVESGTDDALIIEDFKKVISYGNDPKDFRANHARFSKKFEKEQAHNPLFKLCNMFSKLEFAKLLDYGSSEPNPFTGNTGLGTWASDGPVSARLVSAYTTPDKNGTLMGAIQFNLKKGNFLLSQKNSKYPALEINFDGSENLKSYRLYQLLPQRMNKLNERDDYVGYGLSFPMPAIFELQDKEKPLKLKANISATLCTNEKCSAYKLSPLLDITIDEEIFGTDVNNYVLSAFNNRPKDNNKNIKFQKAVVEKNEFDDMILRVEYKTGINPAAFEIFIKNDHNILFGRPKVAAQDGFITAYFPILTPGIQAEGKNVTLTAGEIGNSVTETVRLEAPSIFDSRRPDLSLGIVFLALMGGFLLNFMPCVFPVLSLKIFSLLQFGGLRQSSLRKGFLLTAAGIYFSFGAIIVLLLSLKSMGFVLGWGIQFQNIWFLSLMILVIILFIAQILGYIQFTLPQWTSKIYKVKSEALLSFLTGFLLVLLSTPCTAPYLGTAVGFALSGSPSDIIIIMSAIAIGLSIPYLLFAAFPELAVLLPPPGNWMNYLSRIMCLMLFLTVLWLLSIIAAQTSGTTGWLMGACAIALLGILWLRRVFLDSVYQEGIDNAGRQKLRKIYNITALVLALPVISFYFHYGYTKFEQHLSEVMLTKKLKIDNIYIRQRLREGKNILVNVGADWCLTCKFNEFTVLNSYMKENFLDKYNLEVVDVDWTDYNREVLDFMEKYGRKGLPFYVLFSSKFPEGLVLPEVLTEKNFYNILKEM